MADVVQPDAPAAPTHTTEKQAVEALVLPSDSEVTNATPALHSPVEKAGKGKGLRALRDRIALRRSYSTKHSSLSSPTLLSPSPGEHSADTQEDGTGVPQNAKRARVAALERLISGRLGAKKGGKRSKDVGAASVAVPLDTAPSASSTSTNPATERVEQVLASIAEVAPSAPSPEGAAEPTASAAIGSLESDPEPLPLARKIQSLLSSLPPFLSFETPADAPDSAPPQDGSNATTPPSPSAPTPIPDSSLFSLLSSPTIMNGSLSRGRESVWAMLDNLRLKTLKTSADTDSSSNAGTAPAPASDAEAPSVLEDDDSVMFYGPLVPDAHSSVELARSEIVSVDENGTVVEVLLDDAPPPLARRASRPPSLTDGAVLQAEKFSWHWPFHRSRPAPSPQPKTVEKRLWVPSTDKLSLQVMWWGYRLYVHRRPGVWDEDADFICCTL